MDKKQQTKIVHFFSLTMLADSLIKSLREISEHSVFYIINDGYVSKDYINSEDVFLYNTKNEKECREVLEFINSEVEIVLFHFMDGSKYKIANLLNKNIKKVWCIWGNDLYENNYFIDYPLYGKHTKSFLRNRKSFIYRVIHRLRLKKKIFKILLFCKENHLFTKQLSDQFVNFGVNRYITLRGFTAFSYIVPKEVDILKPLFPDKIFFHLYSNPELEQFQHFSEPNENSINILIGNSAAYTNNHLDSFEILRHIDLGNRKIIVPLNYGGDQAYVQKVISRGRALFGSNFEPLTERLSLEKYSELLSSCSIAIMNQRRQQSGGNLFHLIGSGVKVYMHPENGFYDYFKNNNVKVYDIDGFSKTYCEKVNLSENRISLLNLYSREHFEEQILSLKSLLK